jgi:hypothetical protein
MRMDALLNGSVGQSAQRSSIDRMLQSPIQIMSQSKFFAGKQGPVLAGLTLLALSQVCAPAWGQPGQRRQGETLPVAQRADLRRDVAHEQSRKNEDQANAPQERRLSPLQRAELRRQLREQAREQARSHASGSAAPSDKKP